MLKGYSSLWQRIFFHIVFWLLFSAFDIVTALFVWPENIPAKYFMFFLLTKIPSVIFFYFLFYLEALQPFLLRFLIGFIIYYIITHWVQCLTLQITLNDKVLINISKGFIEIFKDVGYLDLFNPKVISANLNQMVFSFFPIGIKFALDLYVTSVQKQVLQIESAKAELNYLRNQINPHFIFNVINNAYYYVFKKDQESAKLLLKLANIIRYTVEETGELLVLIEKEITILQDLIAIEKIRSSTHSAITYSEEIEITDIAKVKILPLTLVTLLENAIKHSVGTNEKSGFVRSILKVKSLEVEFLIINSINTQMAENSTGIGLKNLRRRLDLVYGDDYNLTVQKEESQYQAHLKIRLL